MFIFEWIANIAFAVVFLCLVEGTYKCLTARDTTTSHGEEAAGGLTFVFIFLPLWFVFFMSLAIYLLLPIWILFFAVLVALLFVYR
jgi:hypothetical protein